MRVDDARRVCSLRVHCMLRLFNHVVTNNKSFCPAKIRGDMLTLVAALSRKGGGCVYDINFRAP